MAAPALLQLLALASSAAPQPAPYRQLTKACGSSRPIGGNHPVATVAACEALCDAQAAAAPGTGQPAW